MLAKSSNICLPTLPPGTLWTLCWMKKYTKGTKVPKKAPARYLRYFTARKLFGLSARHPRVHGSVATKYEIIKISCQSWSSVEVTYVHPPHVRDRKTPMNATALGRDEFGRAVRRYHSPTNTNRGPFAWLAARLYDYQFAPVPEVIAINNMKNERSG